ncbi:MAG: acyl-CoA thioesterase [Chloroflexota bacterium]
MSATEFPFHSRVPVRFRDVDALGHVNNAVYFTYMEIARGEMVMDLLSIKQPRDFPIILGEACCRYHSPARFGETLQVGLGVSRFGNKSFDIIYQIDGQDGRLVATGRTTMVMYDYESQKTVSVPPEFKEKIEARQEGWER